MDNQAIVEAPPHLYPLPGFHEPFAAMSHLLGAFVFFILCCVLLMRGRHNRSGLIYLGIYAVSVVTLLALSGVYHMLIRGGSPNLVLGRLDHSAIFAFIAGSFTPAHGILFRGWQRWVPLFLIWTIAIAGITLKTIFFDEMPHWLGLTLYLAMGWFGLFSGILLARRNGFHFIKPLLIGGVAYSIGGVIDVLPWFIVVPGVVHPHEVFHVAVLMGAFWHWLFICQFASGAPSESRMCKTGVRLG